MRIKAVAVAIAVAVAKDSQMEQGNGWMGRWMRWTDGWMDALAAAVCAVPSD